MRDRFLWQYVPLFRTLLIIVSSKISGCQMVRSEHIIRFPEWIPIQIKIDPLRDDTRSSMQHLVT